MITFFVIVGVLVVGWLLQRYFLYRGARQHVRQLYQNEIDSWKK